MDTMFQHLNLSCLITRSDGTNWKLFSLVNLVLAQRENKHHRDDSKTT